MAWRWRVCECRLKSHVTGCKDNLSKMTTANKITILRVLLVPFFIVQVLYYTASHDEVYRLCALLSFALAAISDGIDGYIARRYNQRSELGALLDPLADKLLLVSGTVLLSLNNQPMLEQIPLWFVTTIVSRDVLLVIGAVVVYYTCGAVEVKPRNPDDVFTILLDPSKTNRDFNWKISTPLETGIKAAVEWYKTHGITQTYTHLKEARK